MPGTDSYARPTEHLPSSTIRTRELVWHLVELLGTARALVLTRLTRPGRSWDFSPTIRPIVTVTLAPLTAPSPKSMLRTRAQGRFHRELFPQNSLRWVSTQ